MTRTAKILVIDDEQNMHYSFQKLLGKEHEVVSARSAREGIAAVEREKPDVVVMDIKMPGMSGLDALKALREIDSRIPVIMMTAFGTVDTAISAMKHGAYEYLLKPFDSGRMQEVVDKAIDSSLRMKRHVSLPSSVSTATIAEAGDTVVGSSPAMQEVYKLIGQVAAQDVTVLIRGESGTGKELVARAIYQHSQRAHLPYLEINCAALPETLLESELFGYERGAFTGAVKRHIGKFEQVHNGTLFLDEIGEMSLLTQSKVLRVIQHGEFSRVGGEDIIKTNVRLIAATNRNLEDMMRAGKFREDLYYRLNIITIQLPSLRERRSDISELVDYFIARAAAEAGKQIHSIEKTALSKLEAYHWPGNVRQLQNCIRRAVVLCRGMALATEDLELESVEAAPEVNAAGNADEAIEKLVFELAAKGSLSGQLWPATERALIKAALKICQGNQVRAANLLGIHRNTLRNRIEKYKLQNGN